MRKAGLVLLSAVLCLMTSLAQAASFSYNNFDVRLGAGPTTYGIAGSYQLLDNVYALGRFDSKFEGDWDLAGGVGFNGPVNPLIDVTGQFLIHNIKEKAGDYFGDDFMPELNIGARAWLFENIEIHGKMGELIDSNDSHFLWEIGGRFYSTDQLVLGASAFNNGMYGNQLLMEVRFNTDYRVQQYGHGSLVLS